MQTITGQRRAFGPMILYLSLSLALGTGGCSFVPDYRPPDVDPAPAWLAPRTSADPAAKIDAGWWKSFGNSELDRVMEQGIAGNFTLQAAVARIAQAGGLADVVGGTLWPSIGLAGTYDHARGLKSSDTRQILAQATYELDFWGKNRATADSAQAAAEASAFDADTAAMTLRASIADTYFQILSLRERIRLARDIARDARQVLALIEVQRANGTATDLQIQQQLAAVASFDAAVPALQQQADIALHALAVLAGQAPERFGVDGGNLDELFLPGVEAGLPAQLLERRPDIRAAEARLASANFDIGAARAAFFPNISLTGAVGLGASKSLSQLFPPAAMSSFGAGLVQPLFQGGQLEGQLNVSKAKRAELAATYRQTVLSAFQDVEDALSILRNVGAQELVETKAEAAASKAAELARLQYGLGNADYLTVLTTELALYQTRDALLQLKLQHFQATVHLIRALGGGFGSPGGTPLPPLAPAAQSNGDRS